MQDAPLCTEGIPDTRPMTQDRHVLLPGERGWYAGHLIVPSLFSPPQALIPESHYRLSGRLPPTPALPHPAPTATLKSSPQTEEKTNFRYHYLFYSLSSSRFVQHIRTGMKGKRIAYFNSIFPKYMIFETMPLSLGGAAGEKSIQKLLWY